jgi:hypothetical protein
VLAFLVQKTEPWTLVTIPIDSMGLVDEVVVTGDALL